ncbi:FAD-dependent oxidoreductase domain-containing protein 2-like [Patiria miniata]|uniref:FAD-dependent oxidoreductase domain-containing protein 2 n=1 Tax=Patiria miniata TaxID=46514 RepID=A0A914AQ95_PATMI|nr:FAD-dependent oxidoreductase domain-containing protein 2-like [Patiria miniata]XP_038065610.1 FAD-dependent oxidoreductase domain-containing protein 2-like [Patiria miniata]
MTTTWYAFLLVLLSQLIGNLQAGWHTGTAPPAGQSWQYCVVGAGPGGLQMGFFLDRAGRDYVILERANTSGVFFETYPRHRKLISINKRHTGKTNKEFNLRHDWNSLLSDDESLQMTHYSKDFFPHADTYVKYLKDYAQKLKLNIKYNTNVQNISRSSRNGPFTFLDQHGHSYKCRVMILSSGVSLPNDAHFEGIQHTEGYRTVSLDPEDFEGKSVLILGRGNSAFETADHILGSTNVIHMVAKSRLRMAWETHYVGDLRAVNNGLLDTYQLKSLDGILEGNIEDMAILKRPDGRLILVDRYELEEVLQENVTDSMINSHVTRNMPDNFALREPYDKVIRCMGFKFDNDIFNNDSKPEMGQRKLSKYPQMLASYESTDVPDLFFAGAISHAVDYRKSAGGFIHGFRYTARALFRILEVRYQSVPWPSVRLPITELVNHIIKRINEASGTYQMFSVLADVIILHGDGMECEYIEEFPVKLLPELSSITGRNASRVIVVSMEYGKDFSGPGKDIFGPMRATALPVLAHLSNFLHPVLYYYSALPTERDMSALDPKEVLPSPDRLHHIVEDFLTDWTAPVSHILVLRRFLESCIGSDLRYYFDASCFQLAMTHTAVPIQCQKHYLQGQGLKGTDLHWQHVQEMQNILGSVAMEAASEGGSSVWRQR